MAHWHQLLEHVLVDKRITTDEVQFIHDYLQEDGQLDVDDVRFLVELMVGSNEVCREFDELFFPVLKHVFMKDGHIDTSEQFFLLKMIYGDGKVRAAELEFLKELRCESQHVSPEFDELCQTAQRAHPTSWDIGGAPANASPAGNSGW